MAHDGTPATPRRPRLTGTIRFRLAIGMYVFAAVLVVLWVVLALTGPDPDRPAYLLAPLAISLSATSMLLGARQ